MKTADPELMRAINRFHVMDAIRRFGPIARVEICDRTDLSATTVSAITGALLDDGLVITHQLGGIRDAARGRPRVLLDLNPDAAHVVGARIAPDRITIATTNFRADVRASLTLPVRVGRHSVPVAVDLIEDGIRRCVADAGLELSQISGVCVGIPGVVERGAGICRASPLFGERDIPLAAELTQRLDGVVATIDSDVNLVTLAEHWFGQARGLDDFLVVSVELGLGLGILHKGELFRGANGLGPDLGDLLARPPNGNGLVRLASIASEESLLSDARAALAGTEHEHAFRLGRGMEKVLERAKAGDPAIVALLRAAGEALGFAIANLIVLFAPPKVILAGPALAAGDALVAPLRETVAALLPPSLADVADLVVHEWTEDIWARGAAAMTLRDLYGAPWGTTGPAPHR
ncbi:ROK family transcriptional regulator [Mesorhizobium sp. BR1-1-16]|uniref:ROK family transcriptional regulator n=1 Tax=Mesorhizobium sp. BR1-1-16 TaxID=2876653 RepID=UPI001CCC5026|nr:ROK family transcriptional regulator [Mesorhizobium sp. BR1-1-16]MBZ9938714.1 ROK family transcriptional regulator [Mesorhizobium sp. BR1-1-16]